MTYTKKLDDKIKELNSTRVYKKVTPMHTLDWYIKWVASAFVLAGMSMRGIDGLQLYDLSVSMIGIALWLWVSILWKDRALILLNSAGLLFLIRNLITSMMNV